MKAALLSLVPFVALASAGGADYTNTSPSCPAPVPVYQGGDNCPTYSKIKRGGGSYSAAAPQPITVDCCCPCTVIKHECAPATPDNRKLIHDDNVCKSFDYSTCTNGYKGDDATYVPSGDYSGESPASTDDYSAPTATPTDDCEEATPTAAYDTSYATPTDSYGESAGQSPAWKPRGRGPYGTGAGPAPTDDCEDKDSTAAAYATPTDSYGSAPTDSYATPTDSYGSAPTGSYGSDGSDNTSYAAADNSDNSTDSSDSS